MKLLKEKENIAYDMLYLVPHSLVRKDGMDSNFAMKTEFENNGVFYGMGQIVITENHIVLETTRCVCFNMTLQEG